MMGLRNGVTEKESVLKLHQKCDDGEGGAFGPWPTLEEYLRPALSKIRLKFNAAWEILQQAGMFQPLVCTVYFFHRNSTEDTSNEY